jgi:hypothetical protein
MKRIFATFTTACLVGGSFATPALAYDLDHKKDLNGMKVSADATAGPNPKVVIANGDKVIAHCRIEFVFNQRSPVPRVASVRPGKRVILTAPAPEGTEKLLVTTTCKPPKSKAEKTD